MSASGGTVYLLDDDPDMVRALTRLLRSRRFAVQAFTSVSAFLADYKAVAEACLVLDVAMPELDGLTLQQKLSAEGSMLPVVFLTGHGDIPMSVQAIKAGATDFLTKPVDAEALVSAVRVALQSAHTRREQIAEQAALQERYNRLTSREREVMQHVVAGKLNKQIAAEFGTGEQNIKLHRGHVMQKMGMESVADLVRAAERLGLGKAEPHNR